MVVAHPMGRSLAVIVRGPASKSRSSPAPPASPAAAHPSFPPPAFPRPKGPPVPSPEGVGREPRVGEAHETEPRSGDTHLRERPRSRHHTRPAAPSVLNFYTDNARGSRLGLGTPAAPHPHTPLTTTAHGIIALRTTTPRRSQLDGVVAMVQWSLTEPPRSSRSTHAPSTRTRPGCARLPGRSPIPPSPLGERASPARPRAARPLRMHRCRA